MKHLIFSCLFLLLRFSTGAAADLPQATESESDKNVLVFQEVDGLLSVEAEDFFMQTHADKRRWHITTADQLPQIAPDGDPPHLKEASGKAYIEILPDTRRDHADQLVYGENISLNPGLIGVLYYHVYINTPGRYYVWGRIYSTNSEDNGLHVGIDGNWPASGQRMQWTDKNVWAWASKQRTEEKHYGEPHILYLDIDTPGSHVVMFSMREDGTEFDKWLMTNRRDFLSPEGVGPASRIRQCK